MAAILWLAPLPGRAGEGERLERFRVVVEAPEAVVTLLNAHLDIVRWRDHPRTTPEQFDRLYRQAGDQIRTLLATEGYYQPQVTSALDEADDARTARFSVHPGDVARVGAVDLRIGGAIAGEPDAQARLTALRESWALKAGAVFRHADWEAAKRGLLRDILADAFPAARITDSRAEVVAEDGRVDVTVTIDSGPPFSFGELHVTGLERYPAAIIHGINRIEPGERYRQARLLELQTRLQNAGFFSSVLVTADTDPQRAARTPIRVDVVEARPHTGRLGVGYSTDTGYRLQAEHTLRNPFERGWRVDSRLKLEQRAQLLSSEVRLPVEEGGIQWRAGARLERSDVQGEVARKLGFVLARASASGPFERVGSANYVREVRTLGDGTRSDVYALAANYSWTVRALDDLLYPSRGYLLNLQAGGAPGLLVAETTFTRLYAKWAGFHPLGRSATLTLRGEAGAVLTRERAGVPSDFLFRTGGDQSVRGYAYNSLGVRENDAVVGGRVLGVVSAELAYRFTPEWGAAVFVDAGNAADRWQDFSVARGYGVGARWRSPVGPLNLDLAWGEKARDWRLHLFVGITF